VTADDLGAYTEPGASAATRPSEDHDLAVDGQAGVGAEASGTWVDDERARAGAVGGLGTGSRVGRYILRRRLGAGAMGVVFEAHDPDLDRRLAIKVLRVRGHSERRRSVARARLIREAQALAKVDHPNVVAVYDVGRHDRGVFVVMEYVDGRTLHTWRDETTPPRRRILDVFIEAGRGLAAAHAAGVVHRDFKPENVMIDLAGRARVLDFGLARARDEVNVGASVELSDDGLSPTDGDSTTGRHRVPTPDAQTTDRHKVANASAGPETVGSLSEPDRASQRLSDRLTRDGAILGTPAYMSPEQHLAEPVDAASDQFSFCVALYEALYDEAPFRGKTLATRSVQVIQGRVREPPRDADVPRRIRTILLRGLAVDPRERYPSMDALLDELAHDPARARQRWIRSALGAAAVASVAFGAAWLATNNAGRCDATGPLPQWSTARSERIEAALAAVDAPFAQDTAARVRGHLDAYAETWTATRRDACEATHVRGAQSSELLDLRMACLDARAHTFDSLVTRLESADRDTARHAVAAVLHLPPVEDCEDAAALRSGDDAALLSDAQRAAHRQLRTALDDARVEYELGRYVPALAATGPLLEAAVATEHPRLAAEVGLVHGQVLDANGRAAEAETALLDAATAAERAVDPALLGRIRSLLVAVVGDRLARPGEARTWARFAATSLEMAGADASDLAVLDHRLGFVAEKERDLEEQARLQRSALRRYGALDDPDPTVLAAMHKDVAGVLADLGRHDDANDHAERAERIWREHLGPHHPKTIVAIGTRGLLADMRGDYNEGGRLLEGARERLVQALGAEHPHVATLTENLAINLAHRGDLERAETEFRRVLAVEREIYGPSHPQTIGALSNLASILRMREDAQAALAVNEQILTAVMRDPNASDASLKNAHSGLARSYYDLGRYEDAVEPYLETLAYEERFYGVGRPGTAVALGNVVDCLVQARRGAEAWRYAERLAALDDAHTLEPDVEAYAKIMVARALLLRRETGDETRARALLTRGLAVLGDLPAQLERELIAETAAAEGWTI